jgi:hypothetical protein
VPARGLNCPGGFHSGQYVGGRLRHFPCAQFFVGYGRDFDLNIDAVQQRSADFSQIALNDGGGAAAFARGIAVIAAGAYPRCLFAKSTLKSLDPRIKPILNH